MEKSEIIKRIIGVFDEVSSKMENDRFLIYLNDNERKRVKYEQVNKRYKEWKKSRRCIFFGCGKDSVINSHTIPRSSSLNNIAEDYHVLTPAFKNGKIEMIKVGVREASTFPGFCEEHEAFFGIFEKNKRINEDFHFVLQIYRTICREVTIKQYCLDNYLDIKNAYDKLRSDWLNRNMQNELGLDFIKENKIDFKKLDFKNFDLGDRIIESAISKFRREINEIKDSFYFPLSQDVITNKCQSIYGIACKINMVIPVCLAGMGNFHAVNIGRIKNIPCILNILPYQGETYILIVSTRGYEDYIRRYVDDFLNSPEDIIKLIESWMIYGSDHWFISPSTWNKINTNNQDLMLKCMNDLTKNIGYECTFSIFNDLIKEKSFNKSQIVFTTLS